MGAADRSHRVGDGRRLCDHQRHESSQLAARGLTGWIEEWSPDSRKIAVAALRDGTWSLQWIDANTEEKGVITPATPPRIYLRYPEWSPRGDVIVFERGEPKGNIWFLPLR